MTWKGSPPTTISAVRRERYRHLMVVLGVGLLLVLGTILVFASPQLPPEISLGIALVLEFFLPGYFIIRILFPGSAYPSLTDFPISFVSSLAFGASPLPFSVCFTWIGCGSMPSLSSRFGD